MTRGKRLKRWLSAILALVFCLLFFAACQDNPNNGGERAERYKVTFDASPVNSALGLAYYEEGAQIKDPKLSPYNAGYTFEGWYTGLGGTGEKVDFDTAVMPAHELIFYAKWEIEAAKYTITFNTGVGGSVVEDMVRPEGSYISPPKDPTRTPQSGRYYVFKEWQYTDNGVTKRFVFGTMPSYDVELTAVWDEAFAISFNTAYTKLTGINIPNGLTQTALYKEGEILKEPEVPVYPGAHFNGWRNGTSFFSFDEGAKMPKKSLTLTAEWVEATRFPGVFVNIHNTEGGQIPLSIIHGDTKENQIYRGASVGGGYAAGVENFGVNILPPSKAQFKGHGNGAWDNGTQKKPYKIKFAEKQEIAGLAPGKHFVLVPAIHTSTDFTAIRYKVCYDMARTILTNIPYSARSESVDLFINGQYRGVYTLTEDARDAKERIDVPEIKSVSDKPEDIGYIINYDYMAPNDTGVKIDIDYIKADGFDRPNFSIRSPSYDPDEIAINETQFKTYTSYMKTELLKVNTALRSSESQRFNNMKAVADIDSLVDMYIFHEFYGNTDVASGGFWLAKYPTTGENSKGEAYDGKWHFVIPWDLCFTFRDGNLTEGLEIANGRGHAGPNEFITKMWQTSEFKKAVRDRWAVIKADMKEFHEKAYPAWSEYEYKDEILKNFAKGADTNGNGAVPSNWEKIRNWLDVKYAALDKSGYWLP